MTEERLAQQLQFIVECDKLKRIERMTRLHGGGRRENSAEHSWDIAVMALVLAEHANASIDKFRVIEMLLLHDIVEIDAGDTFLYDEAHMLSKAAREDAAAARIFGMLPSDQAVRFRALWEEFEARATPEAQFAASVDRLTGMMHNALNGGGTWKEHGIPLEKILASNAHIADGSKALFDYAASIIARSVEQGDLPQAGRA